MQFRAVVPDRTEVTVVLRGLESLSPPPMRNPAGWTAHVPQGCGGGKRYNMLGIDTSKDKLAVALRDAQTRNLLWEREVPNTHEGIRCLLSSTSQETPWVIEPTGRHSLLAVQMAQACGRTVLMAPPRKAKFFLGSIQDRAKTDLIDGKGLSLFGLCVPLTTYPVKSEPIDTLDQLLKARKGLALARSSLTQQQRDLPSAVAREALAPAISALTGQIKALDKEIGSRIEQTQGFDCAKQILKVHGIGKVTAAAVTSRLVARKFTNPDQFVAYIGLDVAVRDSGKHHGQRRLTKQGDAELRRLLYLCAQASVRTNESPFRAQYERELAKGLPTTAALCAVARKMARLCWSLHKHGTHYDPARVGQPVTQKPNDEQNTEPN
jgi:transposase